MRLRLLAAALLLASCSNALPPYGEVVVVVDTDLPAPRFAGVLRVDLYDDGGRWFSAQEFVRANADDWPASFAVYAPDAARDTTVLVRLRTYPQGRTRAYRGEQFAPRVPFSPPAPPASIDALCKDPPSLALGTTRTLRRGSQSFTPPLSGGTCDDEPATAGAVAASFDVTQAGTYQMGITSTRPAGLEVAMQIRTTCVDPATAIDCSSGLVPSAPAGAPPPPPSLTLDLSPGRYYLVTGGLADGAADLEIGVAPASEWPLLVRGGAAEASAGDAPRLLDGGEDRTPADEPIPDVTVDRLLRVRVRPGEVASTRVVLRAVCAGTQVMLSAGAPHQAVVPSEATTCVDTEAVRVPAPDAVLQAGPPSPDPSEAGSFTASSPCPPAPEGRDAVCIPGGVFLFGDDRLGAPERFAVMPSFWMDRHEVTVADYRAVAAGFSLGGEGPVANDGPFAGPSDPYTAENRCTYSDTPAFQREGWPLNCISWNGARFVCRALGGDLPTEAEWEYAASAADRAVETAYPWGDDAPVCLDACKAATGSCHEAMFGRGDVLGALEGSTACSSTGYGPAPVTTAPGDHGDVVDAVPGLVGLAGGVAELTLDGFEPFDAPCWRGAGLVDPACLEDDPPERSLRGADWFSSSEQASGVGRRGLSPIAPFITAGFRCVYGVPRP